MAMMESFGAAPFKHSKLQHFKDHTFAVSDYQKHMHTLQIVAAATIQAILAERMPVHDTCPQLGE